MQAGVVTENELGKVGPVKRVDAVGAYNTSLNVDLAPFAKLEILAKLRAFFKAGAHSGLGNTAEKVDLFTHSAAV